MFIVYTLESNRSKCIINEVHASFDRIKDREGLTFLEVESIPSPTPTENEVIIGMFINIDSNEIFYEYAEKTLEMMSNEERIAFFKTEIDLLEQKNKTLQDAVDQLIMDSLSL